jgi:hypothetical protein
MNWMHEMQDDVADFAHGRTWKPFIALGCDQQGRHVPTICQRDGGESVDTSRPMPAEASTEIGAESRRERMGRLASWERWALTLGPGLIGSACSVLIVCFAIGSRYA